MNSLSWRVSLLDIVLPKIECEACTDNYGRFVIGALENGYGVTLGNALRRVLLSSLPGAAVTSLRVTDIYHEFAAIPHVKEDMTLFILNIKQLRLKSRSEEPIRLWLKVSHEGVVTAGDIECPPEVEIVNPELELMTVDSDEAELEIELIVERGRGYSTASERGKLSIGQIPVDAIFSPISKVSFEVERARIGQMTNFDRLIMDIWTDETISPADALSAAAQILLRQFSIIANFSGEALIEIEPEEEPTEPSTDALNTSVEELDLTVRAYNCLKRAGITTVGEILEKLKHGDEEMLSIRNFGDKSLLELKDSLREKGFLQD